MNLRSRRASLALTLLAAALLLVAIAGLCAPPAAAAGEKKPDTKAEQPWYLYAKPEDMQWWLDAKFGMFIHWGPISILGKEISWSRYDRAGRGHGPIPTEVYDNLYKKFNPTKYDPDEWVRIAKSAGCKYLVFTTRHHDGFCMFDTATTDYKITNSPYGRDITKMLADACHRAHFRLGFYYSPPDWHHPDYIARNFDRFSQYFHAQVRELMTNYGRVDILWFDGLGGNSKQFHSHELFRMIRTLQPHIIINNRGGLPGDFDTPEQRIGRFQLDRPWESCITLGTQWAYKPNDHITSRDRCIEILVRCVGRGGNLLLNVGPTPTGEIEPRQAQRLAEIGQWLQTYGETIYATRGGPFRPTIHYCTTNRASTVYLHVLKKPPTRGLILQAINRRLLTAHLFKTATTVKFQQTAEKISVYLPPDHWQPPDTIVVLQFDKPVAGAEVKKLVSGSLAFGKPAKASNVYRRMSRFGPDKAFDDDPDTRWATDAGVHAAWLEVDLGKPTTIARAYISEAYSRVRRFQLQRWENGRWVTFFTGTRIGGGAEFTFAPVTTSRVRLNILRATNGPTIWEFQLFGPDQQ